jgi:hypothetical protein
MSIRATQLADRIEQGAALLAAFVEDLSDLQWRATVTPDGRTVGVIVHHVASMYPIEMGLVDEAVAGRAISDVTWKTVARINLEHAKSHTAPTKVEALSLLVRNSREAARGVRRLNDDDLDRAVPFSLSSHAPMTVQFIIEDHALRHPWHHLAAIKRALGLDERAAA